MKNILKYSLAACGAVSLLAGCSDFEDINRNPQTALPEQTKPYYALNKSLNEAQQNPDTAERLFVLNWADASRQNGETGYAGSYNDGWNGAAFNAMSSTMQYCTLAIDLCETNLESGALAEHETAFYKNVLAFARIWRVYLMSEFSDSFGPMPINAFQGVNPEFSSVKDVYYFLYDELAAAIPTIDESVEPTSDEAKCDCSDFKYNATKWKQYGISLWMRLAMRLSEADSAKAKTEFEKAVAAGSGITTADGTFRVQEKNEWNSAAGVMSRVWNIQTVSATFANLTTNLGGASAADILADESKVLYSSADVARYENYIKPADTYLGVLYDRNFLDNSDNPTKQIFFDGIPDKIDPRAMVYYFLPGDYPERKATGYVGYFAQDAATQIEYMYDPDASERKTITGPIDATYCYNGLPFAYGNDKKAEFNGLVNGGEKTYGYIGCYPSLADEYRNSTNKRVFFGPWETYFLIAEAALRGWNAGMTAEAAYNAGIKASLEYTGMGHHYASYIESENYNRVGTSVKFSHTTEPSNVEMDYKNGYTGATGKRMYNYPNAANILYAGHKLNDQLTKIITQKYIANTPWLPLETWSDHRRLGLPFEEIAASSTTLSRMPEWTATSYLGPQKPGYFKQRMKYPSSLKNADPKEYEHAVQLLGGADETVTPIWWAIGGH